MKMTSMMIFMKRLMNIYNIFGTQWFICSEDSAEDVYRNLYETMFEGDFIFVCEVSENYASFLPEDTVDWMEENLE